MKLDQADSERNQRLIAEEMAGLGINLASLGQSADFLAEYTVPVVAGRLRISEFVLDAAPGAPLCRYDLEGRIFLNLTRLTGIPLLHHCRQRHGVAAVYFGNRLNMWFGVRQNAFGDAYAAANLEHWAAPFMGWAAPPANIERIDDGRYADDPR